MSDTRSLVVTCTSVALAAIGGVCLWMYRTRRISYEGFTLTVAQLFLGMVLIGASCWRAGLAPRPEGRLLWPDACELHLGIMQRLLREAVIRQVELVDSLNLGLPQYRLFRTRVTAGDWQAIGRVISAAGSQEEVRIARRSREGMIGQSSGWDEESIISYTYRAGRHP